MSAGASAGRQVALTCCVNASAADSSDTSCCPSIDAAVYLGSSLRLVAALAGSDRPASAAASRARFAPGSHSSGDRNAARIPSVLTALAPSAARMRAAPASNASNAPASTACAHVSGPALHRRGFHAPQNSASLSKLTSRRRRFHRLCPWPVRQAQEEVLQVCVVPASARACDARLLHPDVPVRHMQRAARPQPVRVAVPARHELCREPPHAKASACRVLPSARLPCHRVRAPHVSMAAAAPDGSVFATAVPPGGLLTSPEDKRLYRRLQLPNGLVALLVHDPFMAAAHGTTVSLAAAFVSRFLTRTPQDDGDEMEEDEEEDDEAAVEEEEDEGNGAEPRGAGAPAPEKKAAASLAVSVGSFSDPPAAQGLSHALEHMVFMGSERFPDENEYDSYLQQHGGSSNAWTDAEATVRGLSCFCLLACF